MFSRAIDHCLMSVEAIKDVKGSFRSAAKNLKVKHDKLKKIAKLWLPLSDE